MKCITRPFRPTEQPRLSFSWKQFARGQPGRFSPTSQQGVDKVFRTFRGRKVIPALKINRVKLVDRNEFTEFNPTAARNCLWKPQNRKRGRRVPLRPCTLGTSSDFSPASRIFCAAGACECHDPRSRNGYDGNGNEAEGKNTAASRLAK